MTAAVTPPSDEDRIRLEGRLEELEAALRDIAALEQCLGAPEWCDQLPFRLDLVARVRERENTLPALMERVARLDSTRPLVASLKETRASLISRAQLRLIAVGAGAQVDLSQQLRALLERNPLAYGVTREGQGRGVGPLIAVGLGLAALLSPLTGLHNLVGAAVIAAGGGLLTAAGATWRAARRGAAVWMLETDRITIQPPGADPWFVPLGSLTWVEIATNRSELQLYRTPAVRNLGTPVVPLATTAVQRVAGLIELYRTRSWQVRPRDVDGDCAVMTAALTPGFQGWALVSAVGAAFVRDGGAAEATQAFTGRNVEHVLGEETLLRELGRLPDTVIAQIAPVLNEVQGCAWLPGERLTLALEPRVHLLDGDVALTVGADGENRERLLRWYG